MDWTHVCWAATAALLLAPPAASFVLPLRSGVRVVQPLAATLSPVKERGPTLEETAQVLAVEISKPSAREEMARDWFNAILAARKPDPIFREATEGAMERFVHKEVTPPTRREEAWRFTDLSRLYTKSHEAPPAVVTPAVAKEIHAKVNEYCLDVCEGQLLVFVDGMFRPEFSRTGNLTGKPWQAGSIKEFEAEVQQELLAETAWAPEAGMRHTLAAGSLPFASLNQACLRDTACLVVPESIEMDAPVQFMFVSTSGEHDGASARISHPRLAVLARKRSSAKIVQSYINIGSAVSLANACTTVRLQRRAEVQHLYANELGAKGQLIESVSVSTKKASEYKNVMINVGGHTGRINIDVVMNGTMGKVETEGLTISGEEQELDIHSFIHHLRKDGESNMYQCNIVSGDSHCVFKGRMKLEPRARGVKADQLIRSIMLTDSCVVDAMPTLEVCSGDVDCTHGATVADIDENEAFYLQSRGIGRREARQVLMMGFAAQVYSQVPCEKMRARLARRLYDVCPDVGLQSNYQYLSV